MSARLFAVVTSLCALMIAGACSTPSDSRFVATPPPNDAAFKGVVDVLVRHCGSLDCHGTRQRNLRIYGKESLRLEPGHSPLRPTETTDAEVNEDYQSVVGLEPELISAVFAEGGARPERLTLVRKARGQESHKGDIPIREGDDSDRCITAWLAGTTDVEACTRGANAP